MRAEKYSPSDQKKLVWTFSLLERGPDEEKNVLSITHLIRKYFTLPPGISILW